MAVSGIRSNGVLGCRAPTLDMYNFKKYEVGNLHVLPGRTVDVYLLRGKLNSYDVDISHARKPGNVGDFKCTIKVGKFTVADGKLTYPQRLHVAAAIDSLLTRADFAGEQGRRYQELSALLKQPEPCF